MTAHHLVSEDKALHRCMYCGKDFPADNWNSCFDAWKHYKEIECACGKRTHVRVDTDSSGHDNWIMEKIKSLNLEEKIK